MAAKIRLKRMGAKHVPQYRVVVMDSRTKRDGRAIEEIGIYQPLENPSLIRVDSDRAQYWLGVGAQPTDQVRNILKITGDWQKFKGEKGSEGTLKEPEPKEKFVAPDKGSVVREAITPKKGKGDDSQQKPDSQTSASSSDASNSAADKDSSAELTTSSEESVVEETIIVETPEEVDVIEVETEPAQASDDTSETKKSDDDQSAQ